MTTQELIAAGVETDLFVYDDYAQPRDFTQRLLHLLIAVASDSLAPHDRPAKLLVPEWVTWPVPYGHLKLVGGTMWGVPIEAMPHGAVEEYLKADGLMRDKQCLAAVVTATGRVVLGGF